MKSFHQVMLELIKRDTLTMEVSGYNSPWFPDPSIVKDAFETYTTTVFDFWGEECFFACLNYVNVPTKPLLFCYSHAKGDVKESLPEGVNVTPDCLIDWLYKQLEESLGGRSSYFASEAMSSWLSDKYNPRLIVAPYVVQKSPTVETILKSVRETENVEQAGEILYRELQGDVSSFLYTRTSLFPRGVRQFPEAYYVAALVIGVDLPASASDDEASGIFADLHDMAETLSIKFQMTWGYPQLVKEKERMGEEKAQHEQAKKELERYRKASDVAKQLVAALGPAYETVSQLNRMLKPLPSALIAQYKKVTPYIPPDDKTRYFDRWDFMHHWTVNDINKDTESFRAQISCIILAYLGDGIPGSDAACWRLDPPWQRLSDKRPEFELLGKFLPRLPETLARVLADEQTCVWTDEDEDVFVGLKACFYYPFKTRSPEGLPVADRLTGPLFTLWAVENGGHIDDDSRKLFFSDKSKSGKGWPELKTLPAIYALTEFCDYDEKCDLSATAIRDSSMRFTGVRIDMPIDDEHKLDSLTGALAGFQPTDHEEVEVLGNFLSAVRSIRSVGGEVIKSGRFRGLEVSIPIKPI